MSAADIVIVCALELLGRSASSLPPIRIIEHRPPGASANAVAFARDGVIYIIASAAPFSLARNARLPKECRDVDTLRLVASTIVHEEWHVLNGADEQGAYFAQLTALHQMGLGPGTQAHRQIKQAMHAATSRRR